MRTRISLALAAAALALASPSLAGQAATDVALKTAFEGDFLVGTTLNLDEVYGRDTRDLPTILRHFNALSPENLLKWESVHPQPGRYAFEAADWYVELGEKNGMFLVGHALVWHQQTPGWVFRDAAGNPASRDTLLARMRDHIHTVVGRYRGRIKGWDVVNEALNEDGSMRDSPWRRIIGDDYLAQAFRFAHEADPAAELYYNDYSLENPAKRAGAVRLVRALQAAGVPISGVGLQGHHKMDWPTLEAEDSTITAFADLGMKVMITELDIDVLPRVTGGNTAEVSARAGAPACRCDVNPYVGGMPDSLQQALAKRYADFFRLYRSRRDAITRVTFWGTTDGDSWLNDWPMRGRTNHPLLFGWRGEPKAAFHAVVAEGRGGSAHGDGGGGSAP